MPDLKFVVPAIAGVAALALVAGSLGWVITHPLALVAVVATIVLLVRYSARRNRV